MNTAKQVVLSLSFAIIILGAGCGHKSSHGSPASALPTLPVKVQVVAHQPRVATEEVVGTVRPKLSAVISARSMATLERMAVAPGTTVKAGDLLIQLDAREAQARFDQTVAVRQQARADAVRFTRLLEEKAVTQQEFDAVQARLRVAEASASEAETMLSHMKIVAPFGGVITRKYADVGDLAIPGKPLLEMEDPEALRFEADVPEAAIGRLKVGEQLEVSAPSVTNALEAIVSEIAPAADPGSRTFLVKLDLPKAPGLRSGQFGRVAVPVAEVNALRIPLSALVVRGQLEMVFVETNRQAQMRLVKTGKRLGNDVELVSGLEAGERIVVDEAAKLADGQPLEIKP